MNLSRLEKKLLNQAARASDEHTLVEPGDRIMVCLSGGKDSYALMHVLDLMRRKAPFPVELVAVNLDQGQPGFQQQVIVDWCEERGYAHHMVVRDTYSIVLDKVPEGKTYCSLCSRLRRGILYDTAVDLGCTKIALGHHRDDTIETLLLNLFYAGQLKAMPARLTSDDGRNVVIRPLLFCAEEDIAAFAKEQQFPILPCDLCGSQENLYRKRIKRMLTDLQADNHNVKGNLLNALGNVKPTHLLDLGLRDALNLDEQRQDDESLLAIEGPGCAFGEAMASAK